MINSLLAEPLGKDYCMLINFALAACDEVIMVVRPDISLLPSGEQLLTQLDAFLLGMTESLEWPGTTLLQDTAAVYRFRFSSACAEILCNAANGLYSWLQPDLPEDLCLIRSNGDPWLVSISHEKDAYLDINLDEKCLLVEKIPALKLSSD